MRFTAAVFFLLAVLSGQLEAQPTDSLADGRSGDIEFTSFMPSGHNALATGTFDRKPIKIGGKLLLPAGEAKAPAIVIGHTVGGIKPVLYSRWAKSFNDAGYAVLVVDSFGPRNMKGMWAKGASDFNGAFLIADAFRALALLSSHPRVDPARIAFVGFSMGGITAQYVVHERFRQAVLGDSQLRFATTVSHYPVCHYNFVENKPSPAPSFVFLAEKDDWYPAAACQEYTRFLAARGYGVTTKVYEGAAHGYDEDSAATVVADATVTNTCNPLVVNLDEPLTPRFLRTGALLAPEGADLRTAATSVFRWAGACTTKGATVGVTVGNGNRQEEAVRDTLKALQSVFKPGPS